MRTVMQRIRSLGGSGATSVARGLGWFSVGLGVAEIVAPHLLARLVGTDDGGRTRKTTRALRPRELASRFGLVARPRRGMPVWSRLAGDARDLGLLGFAFRSGRSRADRLMTAAAVVVGVTAFDVWAERKLRRREKPGMAGAVTIGKPRDEVYRFFRELERLPEFMKHVESVRVLDEKRSRWTVRLPGGPRMEWEAEITEDRPGERLAWRSVEGSAFASDGSVSFSRAPGGRGTEVHASMHFAAPSLAKLFADGEVAGDLRRLKQVMETGEVVHAGAGGRDPASRRARGAR